MARVVGVTTGERISAALVEDGKIVLPLRTFPTLDAEPREFEGNALLSMPMEDIGAAIAQLILETCAEPDAVGIGFPGIIRDSAVILESPNMRQAKGANLRDIVAQALAARGLMPKVAIMNSADAVATGLAATHSQMEKFIRVWTLGNGVGFGRHPHTGGVLEGGHITVSLDPKEKYCGCGGNGHLEGIMGHRAMRLRFLDLEPEEVFENAYHGDQRCGDFMRFWHRALASATASCIHMEGPGKFYICGPNARFIQLPLLSQYLQEFVVMTPLQGGIFEVVKSSDEIAILGAAVNCLTSNASKL